MCHFSLWCKKNLTLKSFPFLSVTNQCLINLLGRKMKRRQPKIWINIQEQLRCQRTLGLIVSLTTVSKQPLVIKAFRHPRHSSTLLCLSLSWFALLSRVLPFLQSRQFLCWCDRLQPLSQLSQEIQILAIFSFSLNVLGFTSHTWWIREELISHFPFKFSFMFIPCWTKERKEFNLCRF